MALIDQFMPHATLRQVDHAPVAAEVTRAWQAVRGVDLYRVGIARKLFGLRTLPERVATALRGEPAPFPATAHIDEFTGPESGFHILGEGAHEVVIGAVGRFWQPRIEYARVAPEAFAGFAVPGFGQLAWNLCVSPREGGGGSWITIDLRVRATDEASWLKFQRYWRVIGRFSHLIRHALMRELRAELGAATDDAARALPGDELLGEARFAVTHAIDIEAPPSAVWPWLAQMGGRRAGWYSWDRLDNGGLRSADEIVPALQRLKVGDRIYAGPSGDAAFAVLALAPERALVIGSPSLLPGAPVDGAPYRASWAFVLEPIGDHASHLTVRVRADYEPSLKMSLTRAWLAALHELMERRQLHNLKARAEQHAA